MIKKNIYTILFVLVIYNASVMGYQRWINRELTETQLLFLIPDNWMLNFKLPK